MLRALLMQAMLLFLIIKVGDDMAMSTDEETAEFAYLMRERIGVRCLHYGGEGPVLIALAPRYYKADVVTGEILPDKYLTGKGRDYSTRPSRLPGGKDPELCDKVQDDKRSLVQVRKDPGLLGRWRRWWRESRSSEAGSRKERGKEREKKDGGEAEVRWMTS
jgi:hypothetical protein